MFHRVWSLITQPLSHALRSRRHLAIREGGGRGGSRL